VLKTFSSKLLGYALGRTVLASDQPLLEQMTSAGGDATLAKLASQIVTSRQFRYRRERDEGPPVPVPQVSKAPVAITSNKEGGL
jgi:hypothetical protein